MDWNSYFLDIAEKVSKRSSCCRRQVGAIITTSDMRLIATGYNGTPTGYLNCDKGGCPRCNSKVESGSNLEECLCCHAEENAIVQSAKYGVPTDKCLIFTTISPCLHCAKLIVNTGITKVIFSELYNSDTKAIDFLNKCKIEVTHHLSENIG